MCLGVQATVSFDHPAGAPDRGGTLSIEESSKIDVVATRPDSDEVKLIVTDHLTWDDPEQHLRLLQEKLNAYIAFVQSGQLAKLESPAVPASPRVEVVVALQHPPPLEAREFFLRAGAFLQGVGLGFSWSMQ